MKASDFFYGLNAFLILSIFVWIYRSFRLWVTQTRTPCLKPGNSPRTSPLVSILIPAKNEASNIGACLDSLRRQTYPHTEILVINDNSSDATESILKEMRAVYFNCPLPPEGWTGKNHALDYGASRAKGEWLLFTDADTRHMPQAAASALAHAQEHQLEFLSLLPRCLTGSWIEKVLQPSFMAYLGLWFPFEKVNTPSSPVFFANGQFLLIKRSLYEKLGGHAAVKGAFLEDFALMRAAKQSGARAQCAFGHAVYGTRMYDSWDSIRRGWRRIYLHAFRENPLPLVKNAFSLFFFSILPFLSALQLFFFPSLISAPQMTGIILLNLWILGIAWGAHRAVRAPGLYAALHPFAALAVVFVLLDAAGMALRREKTLWR